MTLSLELLGVAALILLNAFFVAGEYALVTARRTKIQELAEQGKRRGRAPQRNVAGQPAAPPRAANRGRPAAVHRCDAVGRHARKPGYRCPRRAGAVARVRPAD